MAGLNKTCYFCNKPFDKRSNEARTVYRRRKFCSRSCGSKYTKNSQCKPGKEHWNWKGGIRKNDQGYLIHLIDGKTKLQHIIIMEKFLGRKLEAGECVHHCNKIRDYNKIWNLELMLKGEHTRMHQTGSKTSEETKKLFRKIRKGTNKKKNHPQWKKDVTYEKIKVAILNNKTKKQAAESLGICADTLRARINFYIREGL